jgi:hypothetical protein
VRVREDTVAHRRTTIPSPGANLEKAAQDARRRPAHGRETTRLAPAAVGIVDRPG